MNLEEIYQTNSKEIDEAFYDFCFYSGNFETVRDAELHFGNDKYFWEFVEDFYGE